VCYGRSLPLRKFDYFAPRSLSEALAAFRDNGEGGRALAGGTDIVVQMKEGGAKFPMPSYLVSLRHVAELHGIESNGDLRVGAMATMTDIAASEVIHSRCRALADGAGIVGSIQTMNMATVGGNVCNAAPSADTAAPLLAHDATAVIAGPDGQRELPLGDFWQGPGQTVLQPGQLLKELRLPQTPRNTGSVYVRHTPRKQMDIAVVGVAVALTLDGDRVERARIGLAAVGPTPIRATGAEAALEGEPVGDSLFAEAAEKAASEASPISDVRGSAEFRRHILRVTVQRCLLEAAARAQSG
jgi:CO/xanthine dehydrogenase FAD-binding subunit